MAIGSKIIHFSEIDSTMNYCKKLALSGEPEGTIVSTEYQNIGRGRFDRKWISPYGVNIQISILLKPKIEHLPYLNMAASLAICETTEMLTNADAFIKWPNDVQVNNKKLAGILIESSLSGRNVEYSILGIGFNVNIDVETYTDIKDIATSLKNITKSTLDKNTVSEILYKRLDHYYSKVTRGESLTNQWASKISTIGKEITVGFPGTKRKSLSGKAESILPDGSIQVILQDGTIFNASSGEVSISNI